MASILDRYGIKEVADVTFYKINTDGTRGAPVLYLDTLKVSTIEQTGESAEARGGKGNPPLISWDYGKEINVTLEDALFSAKSMAIMFGNGTLKGSSSITRTVSKSMISSDGKFTILNKEYEISKLVNVTYYDENGNVDSTKANYEFITFDQAIVGQEIEISANSFPGTYYVTGDTYARSEKTGDDEFFQFVIPKAKVQSENTITLEAEGDPSVFNMSLRVLRPADGVMMKLIKYTTGEEVTVEAGSTINLTVPAGTTSASSSDAEVATVDTTGKVTGVKDGRVVITFSDSAGHELGAAEVTVTPKATPANG